MTALRLSTLLVIVAGVIFGTAGTAQALGPADAAPIAVGILRIQVGAVALLLAMPLLGARRGRILELWRQPAILLAALGAALYQPLFFGAVSQVGVALGTLVAVGSQPIFAGIFGWIVLRHRLTAGWLAATAIAVAGLVLRSWEGIDGANALGLVFSLGAGLCAAAYSVGAKHQLDRGATSIEIPSAAFVLGGLLLIPLLVTQPLAWVATPGGITLALYLGIVTMAIANLLLTRGIHGLAPGPVATLMLTDPVVATLLGVVVLGETLTPLAALGLVLVLAGLVLQGVFIARAEPRDLEPAPVL